MSNIHTLLPKLMVNRAFIDEFVSADAPCFALSMVEERKQPYSLLALCPSEPIPPQISDRGCGFGHALLGNDAFEVIQFSFWFYGFKTYNTLVNPNNPLVQAVLQQMLESGDYFFFALNPDNSVTTYRTDVDQECLQGLKANLDRIQNSTTTDSQYRQALSDFIISSDPNDVLLNWVCQDKLEYMNLSTNRMELTPAEPSKKREERMDSMHPITERHMQIASQIDREVMAIAQSAESAEAVDEAIIAMMPSHMTGFKHLLDTLGAGGLDRLCVEYPGFYRFAHMMERVAIGCRDGLFDDLIRA